MPGNACDVTAFLLSFLRDAPVPEVQLEGDDPRERGEDDKKTFWANLAASDVRICGIMMFERAALACDSEAFFAFNFVDGLLLNGQCGFYRASLAFLYAICLLIIVLVDSNL